MKMGESWLGAMVAPLSAHETSDVTGCDSQHSKARARAATPGNAAYQRAPIQKSKNLK